MATDSRAQASHYDRFAVHDFAGDAFGRRPSLPFGPPFSSRALVTNVALRPAAFAAPANSSRGVQAAARTAPAAQSTSAAARHAHLPYPAITAAIPAQPSSAATANKPACQGAFPSRSAPTRFLTKLPTAKPARRATYSTSTVLSYCAGKSTTPAAITEPSATTLVDPSKLHVAAAPAAEAPELGPAALSYVPAAA